MPGDLRPASSTPVYHVLTPGDHYSPRTGSAIPTVVHGLASGAERSDDTSRWPQHVVVQSGTWGERYDSATALEYAGGPPPSRRERLADAAMGRLGLRRPFATRAYRPVAERLQSAAPGVVIAHNAAALARLMDGATEHRVILYAHNDLFRSFSPAEASRTVASSHAVVCVSDALRRSMLVHVPRKLHDRFHVVRNGVDAVQFSPRLVPRSGEPLRVGFVGRMIPDKGADVLARAAADLRRDDIDFVFVGSHGFDPSAALTEYEVSVRKIAGSAPAVRFVPFTDRAKLPELLRELDVLVIPSTWEDPCPLTVGEGMASGLAVVAATVGGIPEQLGNAGILVDSGDSKALARVLRQLADDRIRVRQLGTAARERALQNDWSSAWLALSRLLASIDPTAR